MTFDESDFVKDLQISHKSAVWFAMLSDGRTVYQDDGRPGVDPHQAWLRLAAFVKETGLAIVDMGLKFRSNQVLQPVQPNADGYYFGRGALSGFGIKTFHYYYLGSCVGDRLLVGRWVVPDLQLQEVTLRDVDVAVANNNLILNPKA